MWRPGASPPPLACALVLALAVACSLFAVAASEDATSPHSKWDNSSSKSLTFVVDTTTSMGEEIGAVKEAITDIFNHMKSTYAGHTATYILVDFNDPNVTLVSKTTDTYEFGKHINNLGLRSPAPGHCGEMSMGGLRVALEASAPKSNIFLFTDATARDHAEEGPKVISLLQRNKNKVFFVLTGTCGDYDKPSYEIYETVRTLSNGHIFRLTREEVVQVLKFVKENLGTKEPLYVGHLKPGEPKSSTIPVDGTMKELTVTVTGRNSRISFKDSTGKEVPGFSTLHLGSVQSKTVYSPTPGIWSVIVSADSEGRFVVTADTTMGVIYGFAVEPTDKITETAPRPLKGNNNFLLIQVKNSSDTIILTEVKIKDSSYNIVTTMPLQPVVSAPDTFKTDHFLPPTFTFFLEVHGKDSKRNSVVRISESGILVQEAEPPLITSTELTATIKSPFKLTCHVESLIPFNVVWYKGTDKISTEEEFQQTARFYYLIANITRESAGEYSCEARNTAGTVKQHLTLHVKDAPPVVKTPKTIELLANKSGEIACEIDSDIDYTVKWTRKEASGTVQSVGGGKYTIAGTGNLSVAFVEKSDEGTYQCTASSKAGSGTSEVLVHVLESVQVTVALNKLEFKAKEHVQLVCTASGSPPVTIQWAKGLTIIKDSDSKIRHEDNKLFLDIDNATKSDEGIYECEGKNKVNIDRRTIELKYLETPTVNLTAPPTPPLIGNEYVVHCSASGSPKADISWIMNGSKIISDHSEQILDNGTLIIHKLFLNHTGLYQCVAENKVGKDIANISMDVGSIPEFEKELKDNVNIDVLTNGIILCKVSGHPVPEITWSRTDGKSLSDRFSSGASCSMNLTEALPEDEGAYIVTAKNKFGITTKEFKMHIEVSHALPTVKTPKTIELLANQPGAIPCQIASDIDYSVIWSRKETSGTVKSITGGKYTIADTGNLSLSLVTKSDEGIYQCTARNKAGNRTSEISVDVIESVQVAASSNKLEFKVNEHVEVLCSASGTPPITLQWTKGGTIIEASDPRIRQENNKLFLDVNKGTQSDEGIYECEGKNKVNTDRRTIELKYLEAPTLNLTAPSTQTLIGSEYVAHCSGSGSPKPEISWRINGTKIISGHSEQILDNGTLIIHKLSLNHTGLHQCIAENKVGKEIANRSIEVGSIPEFQKEVKDNISIDVLTTGIIACSVYGHPDPKITWSRTDGNPLSERFATGSSCSMHLTNAHPEDEGTYNVTAINKFGITTKQFRIFITGIEKPVLVEGNAEEISISKKQKELPCLVERGNPPPTVKWYKDGAPLLEEALSLLGGSILPNRSLLLDYVKHDNEGTYECEVSNFGGKASRRVNVLVKDAPYFTDGIYTSIKVKVKNSVVLPCKANGNPVPTIKWTKDGLPFVAGYLGDGGDLLIKQPEKENNGTYECVATSPVGQSKKTIDLHVQYSPKIQQLNDIAPKRGEEVTLDCRVDAYPAAKIKWRKNGAPLLSGNISYSENHSFFRFAADSSTSGVYECIAINEVDKDKTEFSVTATEAPFFANNRENFHVSRGENVTFSCDSGALPDPDYIWTKRDALGREQPDMFASLPFTQRELTLTRVNATHKGMYTCKAVNRAGTAVKTFVLLYYTPPLITHIDDIILRKGSRLEKICYASGEPPPQVSWLKNGKPTKHDRGNGFLLIDNMTTDHTGIYTCVARNNDSTAEQNVEILLEEPPAMEDSYATTVEAKKGDKFMLYCPVEAGIPKPVLKWYKNNKPIVSTSSIFSKPSVQSLRIKKVEAADSAVYLCNASNSAGTALAEIFLRVLIAPQFINKKNNKPTNEFIGNKIELDCSNSGKPQPKVLWFRDSHPLTQFVVPHAVFHGDKLIIPRSKETDMGEYRCSVENSAGLIERTFEVKLFARETRPPGVWSRWTSWSECSAPCGNSARVKKRTCQGPHATCTGDAVEWERCIVKRCKVDGGWSSWGVWTKCSEKCGSGERIRLRQCDSPPSQHGGRMCPGLNEQKQVCNTHPCPVDGSWSEWSKWDICKKCAETNTKRRRSCTSPAPAFNGSTCFGDKEETKRCPRDGCPVSGGWSDWSEWSPCSATCGYSIKSRERACDNPTPSNKGLFCIGEGREELQCETTPCDNIPLLTSLDIGGTLNGFDISRFFMKGTITDKSDGRLFYTEINDAFLHHGIRGWFPYHSLVLSPFLWLTAIQNGKAVNGFTLTEGRFKMQTRVTFDSGEKLSISHEGYGVKDNCLNVYAHIQGTMPLFHRHRKIKMHPYQEDYVSTEPGELHVNSENRAELAKENYIFSWKITRRINYDAKLKKLEYPTQTLMVKSIKPTKIKFEATSLVTESETVCPGGFSLTKTGHCQDIDECSNRTLQECHFTQTCINTKGSHTCSCPSGTEASADGGCLDTTHCFPNQTEIAGICHDAVDPCKTHSDPCKEKEMCVRNGGSTKCISLSCPTDYSRVKDSNSCVKYCNITDCNSNATISETVHYKVLNLMKTPAPFKNIIKLPLNVEKSRLPHTLYRIIGNIDDNPFRVKVLDEKGVVYSTVRLKKGQEYRGTFAASTYDSHSTILYYNIFEVTIITAEDL